MRCTEATPFPESLSLGFGGGQRDPGNKVGTEEMISVPLRNFSILNNEHIPRELKIKETVGYTVKVFIYVVKIKSTSAGKINYEQN